MRVKVERTGGFAGLEETVAAYDTGDLSEQEAAKVDEALAAIGAAMDRGEPAEVGADLFTYRITAGDGSGRGRVYTVSGEPLPELAQALAVLSRQE
ncbi:protealysin inhibitor emfourin [Nonomuraea zeae]|uniref:Metalloprotease n=1 Tax=Nonomuraea zeae TaxID=1642303 RepID=A0A5S4GIC3_9ACTN|nr:protealysin inhibitor emfourin [Nonomuraea zeae]TMR25990.1 hypothetical protein ETD85_43955 [Nonomuraea zeae]